MTKIIAIAGGTGSGKTTAAKYLVKVLGQDQVRVISFDDYYRDQTAKPMSERVKTNYDHPQALEAELLAKHLEDLKRGKVIDRPVYDFSVHTRVSKTVKIKPSKYVIVEGILVLAYELLRPLFNLKIFMDEPADIRFIRRLRRDISERGRSVESVAEQYLTTVRPMHEKFVEPTKEFADYVIMGERNEAEIDRVIGRW